MRWCKSRQWMVFVFWVVIIISRTHFSYAENVDWGHEEAYRPSPVIFLHGFGMGGPNSWDDAIAALSPYFSAYYPGIAYLRTVDFVDTLAPERVRFINCNSSIDTYQDGDYYVSTGERVAGVSPGWADILFHSVKAVTQELERHMNSPEHLIFIAHSMGGLAAREFLTNSKYDSERNRVQKLITIGSPHLGSELASYARILTRYQRFGFIALPITVAFSVFADIIEEQVHFIGFVDMGGDAIADMRPGSDFLDTLNNRLQPEWIRHLLIYGRIKGLRNILLNDPQGGDGVVDVHSQRGIVYNNRREEGRVFPLDDRLEEFPPELEIISMHEREVVASVEGDSPPLLKLIDYTEPLLTIEEPVPSQAVFAENPFSVKGVICHEFFPADCIVRIKGGIREEGAPAYTIKEGKLLKPSLLWDPFDEDSPVAQLEEELQGFPVPGEYELIVEIENPAGITTSASIPITVEECTGFNPAGWLERWESATEGIKGSKEPFMGDVGPWEISYHTYEPPSPCGLFEIIQKDGNKTALLTTYPTSGDRVIYAGFVRCLGRGMNVPVRPTTEFCCTVGGEIAPGRASKGNNYVSRICATVKFSNGYFLTYAFAHDADYTGEADGSFPYWQTICVNELGEIIRNVHDDYANTYGDIPEALAIIHVSFEVWADPSVAEGAVSWAKWDNIGIMGNDEGGGD
ncbi:MAG: alpha/beta hydrolase [Candidatus Omnitrophica bacterium]|nr:alpha/beta hydrolase [Candidatus Omnitrophota bacterium]